MSSMQFGEHFIDELKARLRPSEVIGRYVKLKRQGREFAALSPFTSEKTPSFFVNDEKGFYHCFSSGKHGDIISFLMETQGLSFPEAVEHLAQMAGMSMPSVDPDAEKRAAANKKTISWIEKAQDFFETSLRRDVGKHAREYLKSRGLSDADCKRFGIGFAPESFDALRDELTQMGAKLTDLIEAGLLVQPDDTSKKPWDRFRNRIMFPIADTRGRLIAFGGRAMEANAKAKYLNSPETNLFHKGRVLYRYKDARTALHAPKNPARGLIVAEGYMDVIALAKAGFDHACAPLGTALSEEQIALLWRAGPEPILCFDGDKAGVRAAYRSIDRAIPLLKPGQTLRFVMMPEGQDPDDLIRDQGKNAMEELLSNSIALVDLLWARELGKETLDTPEARAGLKDRIFKLLRDFTHDGVKDQYKQVLLDKFDQAFGRRKAFQGRTYGQSQGRLGRFVKPRPELQNKMRAKPMGEMRERRIVGAALFWPEMLEHIDQTLFSLEFTNENCQRLQNSLLNYWQNTSAVDKRGVHAHIEDEGLGDVLAAFRRDYDLVAAATGGKQANLTKRIDVWRKEARKLNRPQSGEKRETRDRIIDTINAENRDALLRLGRLAKAGRE